MMSAIKGMGRRAAGQALLKARGPEEQAAAASKEKSENL